MLKSRYVVFAGLLGLAINGCQQKDDKPLGDTSQGATAAQGLYGIDLASDQLILIDTMTGAGTAIGSLGFDAQTVGADFACDGTMWAFSSIGNNQHVLYTVDLMTGAATIVQTFDTTGYPTGVGFEIGPDETTFYWRAGQFLNTLDVANAAIVNVATYNTSAVNLTVNPSTCGDLISIANNQLFFIAADGTATAGPTTNSGFSSLAAAPDGTLYGHSGSNLYTVDAATGTSTLVGPIGFSAPGTAFGPDTITCTSSCPSCSPLTQGFWKRQCKGPHPSSEHDNLPSYVNSVNNVDPFTSVASVDDLCDRLHPDPKNSKCEQAEAQFMATQLNLASGRLTLNCCVDGDSTASATVAQIESLLGNSARTFKDCVEAQSLAAGLNEGTALCN